MPTLIQQDVYGQYDSFSIHPLVHQWVRYRLEPERRAEKALQAFLMVTSAIRIPEGQQRQVTNWVFERRIMPHLTAIEKHVDVSDESCAKEEMRNGMSVLASIYMEHERLNLAAEWYKRALTGEERSLGPNHPDTLRTIHDMATVFDEMGQYETALEWYKRALAGQEKSPGPDHPDTLHTVNSMGIVFSNMGQYDTALEYEKRALAGREKLLGPDHPDTLGTINNMAFDFWTQKDYEQALQYWERAYDGWRRVLGDSHPNTQAALNSLTSHRAEASGHGWRE